MENQKDPITRELEQIKREELLDMYKTAKYKVGLISELKAGLGDDIKRNPNGVNIIKKTWKQKLMIGLKKIFTKF